MYEITNSTVKKHVFNEIVLCVGQILDTGIKK